MTEKVWRKEVAAGCQGIGTGPLFDAGRIERHLRNEAKRENLR